MKNTITAMSTSNQLAGKDGWHERKGNQTLPVEGETKEHRGTGTEHTDTLDCGDCDLKATGKRDDLLVCFR